MTHITAQHMHAFNALRAENYDNFALFSCFANGEPTCVIVAINCAAGTYQITPLFVALTPGMILTDHDGIPAGGES